MGSRVVAKFGRTAMVAVVMSACGGAQTQAPGASSPVDEPASAPGSEPSMASSIRYPESTRQDVTDDYHGTKVADPYRWLEDTDSAETAAWVKAQNEVTFAFLGAIPARKKIQERMTALWNFERYGTPYKKGKRYFFSKNDGLQNQAVLYTTMDISGAPRVLLDPNTLSKDGTVALSGTSMSEDGKLMAYGLSQAGSDWVNWQVKDIDTGKDLDDKLEWIKWSSPAWTHDGKGFYYARYPEPPPNAKFDELNFYNKVYYHKLGTPQSADKLVWEDKAEKTHGFGAGVSEDGRYLIIDVRKGTDDQNLVLFQDLESKKKADAVPRYLVKEWKADFSFLGNAGPVFWFKTNLDAPRGRIIAIDTRKPDPANWKELVPQGEDTMEFANAVGGRFVVGYMQDARTVVSVYETTGKKVRDVELPGVGSAGGFWGEFTQTETFYSYTSFNVPSTVYRYDVKSGASSVWKQPKVDFDPDDYENEQVFYESKDGTKVPMFLAHKKGIKKDGNTPTYLYGYGGFNVSLTPWFSVSHLVWMEMGGLIAIPNLRGGGEYGKAWHDAGRKGQKQNVFDDFIGAAEWLIANGWTKSAKLAIAGGSNGGLLVGACMTQRPDLFGAALPAVGVMDMLRFHKFTIGWAWIDDYGSSDDAGQFKVLHAYSPLHSLKEGTKYPPTMVTTADHDDRVVPGHSFKFAAALQHAQGGPAPALIRIETQAGHGAGKPTSKLIEEATDRWAFLVRVLGME